MIRVMLVDNHAPVRERVSRLLVGEPDMRVVGSFDHGSAAVRFAAREAPDVAIVDIAMPDANGVLAGPPSEDPLQRLGAREMEVLKLVVEGASSRQVAMQLGLSSKSIDTYRSRLMTKLDIENLPALVKFAVRRGLTGV